MKFGSEIALRAPFVAEKLTEVILVKQKGLILHCRLWKGEILHL